jgi:epsilon-lactone hydrolase
MARSEQYSERYVCTGLQPPLLGADGLGGQEVAPKGVSMSGREPLPALDVAARQIPIPKSISPEAQAALAMGLFTAPEYPSLEDVAAWRHLIAVQDEAMVAVFAEWKDIDTADVDELTIAGVPVYKVTPLGADPTDPRIYLDIHGGGFTQGRGECCRLLAMYNAQSLGKTVWSIDYRMPPEHPFPAALDDCVEVYRELLDENPPEKIAVGGGSAGGNLAAALVLRARDEGLPLPACLVMLSPAVDLNESGDSFETNMGIDSVLTASLMPAHLLYAGGHDLSDPYISPLFGDFTKGFPPTFISSGTRDLLLSNAVRMHRALRKAGVWADLHILEAAPHGGFMTGTPEDRELDEEVRKFLEYWCPLTGTSGPGVQ